MKKKNIVLITCGVLILVTIVAVLFFFLGKNINSNEISKPNENEINKPNENEISKPEEKEETINLNLDNYTEYFTIQEEVLSCDKSEYTFKVPSGGATLAVDYIKVYQTTKISILPLKKNMVFNNVEISIAVKTGNGWYGNQGTLKIAYDGSGFLTLSANFDWALSKFRETPNPLYQVLYISGNITKGL